MKQPTESSPGRHGAAFNSLRFQVIAIMLLCYLVPALLLGVFTQTVLIKSMRRKTDAALTAGVEYAWTLTAQNVERAIALSRDAIYDGELADAYERWRTGGIADAEYLRLSRAYIERKYSREDLFTFAAYFPVSRPDMYMYTRSGYGPAMAFVSGAQQEILALGEQMDTASCFIQREGEIYLVRNLMNLRLERYGMLVLGIGRDTLFAPLLSLADEWQGSISLRLDGTGGENVDWEKYPQGLSESGDEIRFVRRARGDAYSLDLLIVLSKRLQYREDYAFRILALTIYLLLIPVLGLLAWYVGRRIIKPITLLSNASRRIERGELGVTVPMRGSDELGDLGRAFSKMSRRIEELIDKTYKEELALKNAQIQALQSRINPHFINNALEAINWEARMEKSEAISSMVSALSVLLGASMARQDKRMVTLKEETEVADAYIFFVQQRYDDSLTVRRDWEDVNMSCLVPLLTIQPVLENAVEHGIAPAGGGEITVSCHQTGACVRIEITNTGKPIEPEDREKIDAALRGDTASGSHLGLANIADRLRLIYGGEAGIRVFSDEEKRTVVQIDIPQKRP
ncbi:MAG: sensor histidine kinase [Clostridia bacterium]|nr:sensor histidine kinase [Clostridia bacterium]